MDDIDNYEPSDEEIKEFEEMRRLEKEEEENDCDSCSKCGSFEKFINKVPEKKKNRVTYTYQTESHWAGWLKINGIKW